MILLYELFFAWLTKISTTILSLSESRATNKKNQNLILRDGFNLQQLELKKTERVRTVFFRAKSQFRFRVRSRIYKVKDNIHHWEKLSENANQFIVGQLQAMNISMRI